MMNALFRITLLALAAGLAAAPARAQDAAPDSTAAVHAWDIAPDSVSALAAQADSASADSVEAAIAEAKKAKAARAAVRPGMQSAIDRWVEPKWTTSYQASESAYKLGTGMRMKYLAGGGWSAGSEIEMAKREYRGRDMEDINQRFSNAASKVVPGLYTFNMTIGQDYLRQKAIGLARSGGYMVIEDKYATSLVTWDRPELWAGKSRFSLQAGAGGGQNDFKYDDNLEASASGHLWYRIGEALDVDGGYGVWRRTEDSDVAGRVFENMPSRMDTLKAALGYGSGDQRILSVSYDRAIGVVRKVDPPRGNSLEVIENPDLAKMEQSSRKNEKVEIGSNIQPLSNLTLDFRFARDYFDQQNVVDERLSKETENRTAAAKAIYKYIEGGRIDVQIDKRENDVDYGPVSLSSYVEKENSLKISVVQEITDSLTVTLRGSGSLRQQFYKKKDANPRDADLLYYSFFADMAAGLPFGIDAGVQFTYKQYQTINIDRSLSGDNRTDYTYWVIPRFEIKPTDWLRLGQEYEIKMEFTDFTFKDNENFLDRTTIMHTDAMFRIFRPITLGINHSYLFTDTGSYLSPEGGGERLYGRTNENFEHRFDFKFEYRPSVDFSIYSRSNYRFQESNRLGFVDGEQVVTATRFYDSGELQLGLKRKTKVTETGKVDLNVAWVRRFGPNLTPERREFWEVDMNVEINF